MPEPEPGPPQPEGAGRPPEGADFPRVRAKRPALWLLLVPAVLYCSAPLVANRVGPRVLGLPFLLFWIVAATVVSPLVIWLVSRLDPVFRAGAVEPLPGDDRSGGTEEGR